MGKALIAVDFINDIINEQGKMAGKGYAAFDQRHHTLDKVSRLLHWARGRSIPVIHIGLAFSQHYLEHPEQSPLFGPAKNNQLAREGDWGSQFHEQVAPQASEKQITKRRVSGFYNTDLAATLSSQGITELLVAGVATDMAVQSLVREAHDRDFVCTVIDDCCAAASDEDHSQTLRMLQNVSAVTTLAALTEDND